MWIEQAALASIDLSTAFDVVNVKLLLKRMRIMGLCKYIITVVSKWLETNHLIPTSCLQIDRTAPHITG